MDGWELLGLPAARVGLVAGVGAAVCVVLFLLRPRPPVVMVSSHVLWDQVLPKRRDPLLKDLLMLALQLLMVGAIALALGDPREVLEVEDAAAVQRLWVVDRSLSMGARGDDGWTRIDRVRDLLEGELDALPNHVGVGIVGAAAAAELLAPLGTDRRRTNLALRMLDVSGVEADLAAALELALVQPGLESPIVEVFTDEPGAADLVAAFADRAEVRIRAPFEPRPNLSITAFDLRGSEGIPAEQEALVRVRNRSPFAATAKLGLETATAILGEADLVLGPGEEIVRRYRFAPLPAEGVEAVLRETVFDHHGASLPDALAADDRAFAWIEPVRPVTVVLVSQGNRYLERVLALLPGVDLTLAPPAEWARVRRRAMAADVVFLDGFTPAQVPPRTVWIRPLPDSPFAVAGSVQEPTVTDWNRTHPVFAGLVLQDLVVQRSSILVPAEGDIRLVGSPSGALVLARESAGRKAMAWGFDFGESDLPLRLAFPQTVVNTLLWMRDGRAVGEPPGTKHDLGAPLWVGPEGPLVGGGGETSDSFAATDLLAELAATQAGDERARRRATQTVGLGDGLTPWRAPKPGLYRLAGDGWSQDVAVNLFDSPESDLTALPASEDALARPDDLPPEAPPGRAPWLLLAFGAGAVLLLEFGVYTR